MEITNADQYKSPSPRLLAGQAIEPLMVRFRCGECKGEAVLDVWKGVPTHSHLVGVKMRYYVMEGVTVVRETPAFPGPDAQPVTARRG